MNVTQINVEPISRFFSEIWATYKRQTKIYTLKITAQFRKNYFFKGFDSWRMYPYPKITVFYSRHVHSGFSLWIEGSYISPGAF